MYSLRHTIDYDADNLDRSRAAPHVSEVLRADDDLELPGLVPPPWNIAFSKRFQKT